MHSVINAVGVVRDVSTGLFSPGTVRVVSIVLTNGLIVLFCGLSQLPCSFPSLRLNSPNFTGAYNSRLAGVTPKATVNDAIERDGGPP